MSDDKSQVDEIIVIDDPTAESSLSADMLDRAIATGREMAIRYEERVMATVLGTAENSRNPLLTEDSVGRWYVTAEGDLALVDIRYATEIWTRSRRATFSGIRFKMLNDGRLQSGGMHLLWDKWGVHQGGSDDLNLVRTAEPAELLSMLWGVMRPAMESRGCSLDTLATVADYAEECGVPMLPEAIRWSIDPPKRG